MSDGLAHRPDADPVWEWLVLELPPAGQKMDRPA